MLIQIKSQAGMYSISMHMVKSSSFKENREVRIKYKFFFLPVGWPWAALLNFLWPGIALPSLPNSQRRCLNFIGECSVCHTFSTVNTLYMKLTSVIIMIVFLSMIVLTIVTMIFIIVVDLSYSQAREHPLADIGI